MPIKKKKIWVIVMDGGQAKIFCGLKNNIKFLVELTHTHESNHEHGHDRPGRSFESKSDIRHAYEPRTDWHENQKDVFVHEVCELIYQAYHQKSFDEIYLICPPKILGLMRPHLTFFNPDTEVHEIGKDLVHHSTIEITKVINETLKK